MVSILYRYLLAETVECIYIYFQSKDTKQEQHPKNVNMTIQQTNIDARLHAQSHTLLLGHDAGSPLPCPSAAVGGREGVSLLTLLTEAWCLSAAF